ncbi:MAG: hypothetical protein AB1656_11370 [Candidatus Omnitrophota bacterium]
MAAFLTIDYFILRRLRSFRNEHWRMSRRLAADRLDGETANEEDEK